MNTTKKYWLLYVKELKALSAPFLMLVATYLSFVFYLLFTDMSYMFKAYAFNFRESLMAFMNISLLIFPGILFYTFYDEREQHTSHQMQSLPVPRYMILLQKFLALMSISAVIAVLLTLCYYIIDLRILVYTVPDNVFRRNPVLSTFRFLSLSYVMLGIGVLTTAVLSVIKRYHVLTGIVGFTLLFALYVYITRLFNTAVLNNNLAVTMLPDNSTAYVMNIIFPVLPGTLCVLLGLYLFHRFSDI
ncbi:hypothetical protein ACFL6H_02755 [Candidatus Latescibacterota bacterium]